MDESWGTNLSLLPALRTAQDLLAKRRRGRRLEPIYQQPLSAPDESWGTNRKEREVRQEKEIFAFACPRRGLRASRFIP